MYVIFVLKIQNDFRILLLLAVLLNCIFTKEKKIRMVVIVCFCKYRLPKGKFSTQARIISHFL